MAACRHGSHVRGPDQIIIGREQAASSGGLFHFVPPILLADTTQRSAPHGMESIQKAGRGPPPRPLVQAGELVRKRPVNIV